MEALVCDNVKKIVFFMEAVIGLLVLKFVPCKLIQLESIRH